MGSDASLWLLLSRAQGSLEQPVAAWEVQLPEVALPHHESRDHWQVASAPCDWLLWQQQRWEAQPAKRSVSLFCLCCDRGLPAAHVATQPSLPMPQWVPWIPKRPHVLQSAELKAFQPFEVLSEVSSQHWLSVKLLLVFLEMSEAASDQLVVSSADVLSAHWAQWSALCARQAQAPQAFLAPSSPRSMAAEFWKPSLAPGPSSSLSFS
mmetsp:Transcript_34634/g.62811  ORF Transcript_34634/g.62811 Transcript_34634/m.62811 type:complete len:208 (+) Transcript_34634:869-1492(+)